MIDSPVIVMFFLFYTFLRGTTILLCKKTKRSRGSHRRSVPSDVARSFYLYMKNDKRNAAAPIPIAHAPIVRLPCQ